MAALLITITWILQAHFIPFQHLWSRWHHIVLDKQDRVWSLQIHHIQHNFDWTGLQTKSTSSFSKTHSMCTILKTIGHFHKLSQLPTRSIAFKVATLKGHSHTILPPNFRVRSQRLDYLNFLKYISSEKYECI